MIHVYSNVQKLHKQLLRRRSKKTFLVFNKHITLVKFTIFPLHYVHQNLYYTSFFRFLYQLFCSLSPSLGSSMVQIPSTTTTLSFQIFHTDHSCTSHSTMQIYLSAPPLSPTQYSSSLNDRLITLVAFPLDLVPIHSLRNNL